MMLTESPPSLIQQQVDLSTLNTMALPATARYFSTIQNVDDITTALAFAQQHHLPVWILGGGSNVLFDQCFEGLVLHMQNQGIRLLSETDEQVEINVSAGVDWDQFLQYALQQGWYGLENLAIIPGTVGAAPVQNIGAYGQEVAECIVRVKAIDIATTERVVFDQQACQFSYRDSLFKTQQKGRYIITDVVFSLSKQAQLNISYQPLAQALAGLSAEQLDAAKVRDAVIAIRQSKLPDPKQLPNSGSFFKNPVVSLSHYDTLKMRYPTIPAFETEHGYKLAAAWLIEQCGFKGKQVGRVAMHAQQALVMVNNQAAHYHDVCALREQIQQAVQTQFGLSLEQEPITVSA